MPQTDRSTETYSETLRAPLGWWLFAGFLVVTLFIAVDVPLGLAWSLPTTAIGVVLAVAALGSSRTAVRVDRVGLHAGAATLPYWAMGEVGALDRDTTRILRGPGMDPRAYDLFRTWVPQAVRVDVADSSDPSPYWLVSSQHPHELAEAIRAGLAVGRPDA